MSEEIMEYQRLVDPEDTIQQGRQRGISTWTAAVLVIGGTAGVALLSLPYENRQSGLVGLPLIVFGGIVTAFTGGLIGKSMIIIRQRHEQYRYQLRDPYPVMGEVAYGKCGRLSVSFALYATIFGTAVLCLILTADTLRILLDQTGVHLTTCLLLVVSVAFLTPLTWLDTPKDFWPIGVASGASLAIATVVIVISLIVYKGERPPPTHAPFDFVEFPLLFGAICYGFGGHSTLPTIQVDMKHPEELGKAVILGFSGVVLIYLPVATTAYFVFGSDVDANLLDNFSRGAVLITIQILVLLHLFTSLVLCVNPLHQVLEAAFKIEKKFSWKRALLRTAVMVCILFVGETIPRFGPLLALVGGSTLGLVVYVFPTLFYLKLVSMEGDWEPIHISVKKKILIYMVMILGILTGTMATVSAIINLTSPDSFTYPCYINPNVTVV